MKKLTDMQRYINLMQKVNKVMINESVFDTDTTQTLLYSSFEKLANNTLNVNKVNTNVSDEETYLELECIDESGNKIVFNFKAITSEGDQDGVFSVSEAELVNFTFSSSDGTNNIEIDETGLQEFNQKHGSSLAGLVTDYIDVEQERPDVEDVSLYEEDSLYENAVKKIELIKENDLSQPQVHYFNKLSPENKQFLIHKAKNAIDEYLSKQGISLPDNEYRQAIKVLAIELHEKMQANLNERRKAWVDGSQAVEVKRECQLGGKGDGTSKACNQGDISNLKFSGLSEKKDDGYPEPMAKDFAGGGDYPKTKKKHRITKKKIKEDNFGTPGYSQIRMPQDNIEEFDDNTADVLLGFEPRNVGEGFVEGEEYTVVFDGTSAYIKEPDEEIDEFTEVIGTYDNMDVAQRVADRYNDNAWGTKMTEEEDVEVSSGDKFEDVEGKQYTVNNKSNDKVRIRRNDGEEQEVVPDALKFAKKINEEDIDSSLNKELIVKMIIHLTKNDYLMVNDLLRQLRVEEVSDIKELKTVLMNAPDEILISFLQNKLGNY